MTAGLRPSVMWEVVLVGFIGNGHGWRGPRKEAASLTDSFRQAAAMSPVPVRGACPPGRLGTGGTTFCYSYLYTPVTLLPYRSGVPAPRIA